MPEIVYLVGFMGAGKTCVGRRLADMLQYGFIDLDERIEETAGETIREIFARHGEPFFREMETEELERVSTLARCVIALGGGAFCGQENRRIVQGSGTSVWLDAPASTLYARCTGDDLRPLFGTKTEFDALLERRLPLYRLADLRVDVHGRAVDEIAREIIELAGAR